MKALRSSIAGLVAAGVLAVPVDVRGDAEVPAAVAKGLVIPTGSGLVLAGERVLVRLDQVEAVYVLANPSPKEVRVDVAFMVPEYRYDEATGSYNAVEEFRLMVEGRRVPVPFSARAIVEDGEGRERDVTRDVMAAGLSLERLGGVEDALEVRADGRSVVVEGQGPLARLPTAERQQLVAKGVLRAWGQDVTPEWIVRGGYYWVQRVPAKGTVELRISYRPAAGVDAELSEETLQGACAGESLRRVAAAKQWKAVSVAVAFGAEELPREASGTFELIVDPPKDSVASMCWGRGGEIVKRRAVRKAGGDVTIPDGVTVLYLVP
ncbi:MAG: DUF4424 family protein [Anaeromyxobacter sp.]